MQQVMTAASAHKSLVHPPPAAATVADVMLPTVTTVNRRAPEEARRHDSSPVLDAQAGEPVGIITAADIAAPSRTAMTSTTSGWMPRWPSTRPSLARSQPPSCLSPAVGPSVPGNVERPEAALPA